LSRTTTIFPRRSPTTESRLAASCSSAQHPTCNMRYLHPCAVRFPTRT
jgi:hypothetical protein